MISKNWIFQLQISFVISVTNELRAHQIFQDHTLTSNQTRSVLSIDFKITHRTPNHNYPALKRRKGNLCTDLLDILSSMRER